MVTQLVSVRAKTGLGLSKGILQFFPPNCANSMPKVFFKHTRIVYGFIY